MRRPCASAVDVDDDVVALRARGGDNEVQEDAAEPMVQVACSIGSWNGGEQWPEGLEAAARLGRGRARRYSCKNKRRRCHSGAQ